MVPLSTDVGVPQHEDIHDGETTNPRVLHVPRLGSQQNVGEGAGILRPRPTRSSFICERCHTSFTDVRDVRTDVKRHFDSDCTVSCGGYFPS